MAEAHTLESMTGGRDVVLDKLTEHILWAASTKAQRTEKAAAELAVAIARDMIIDDMREWCFKALDITYGNYVKMNGERPGTEAEADEWDGGMENELADLFEPYADVLSASWLGTHLDDSRLWQEGEITKLASSFAQAVWHELTFDRTINQTLAGIGILESDITEFVRNYQPPTDTEGKRMTQVNMVVNKIIMNLPDEEQLEDELDLASDTDDSLAAGAAGRLGIHMNEALVLRMARAKDPKVVKAWVAQVKAGELLPVDELEVPPVLDRQIGAAAAVGTPPAASALPPGLPPPPPGPGRLAPPPDDPGQLPPPPDDDDASEPAPAATAPAGTLPPPPPPVTMPPPPPRSEAGPAPSKKGGQKSPPPLPGSTPIPAGVLSAIKTYAGMTDKELGDMLGVSRATVNNAAAGKATINANAAQRDALRAVIYAKLSALEKVKDEI